MRPTFLTPLAVRHGLRGAAVLGVVVAVIVAMMMSTTLLMQLVYATVLQMVAILGGSWLAGFAGPLVLAAGAAVLARSAHRRLWRDDEALRAAPIRAAERVAGMQAGALRLFGVAMGPAVAVAGLMLFAGMVVDTREGWDAEAVAMRATSVVPMMARLGAMAALFLYVFVATQGLRWATGQPGGARPWGLVAGVVATHVVEFALSGGSVRAVYWLAMRLWGVGSIALGTVLGAQLFVVAFSAASAVVWLWLARRAWARAEAVYAG